MRNPLLAALFILLSCLLGCKQPPPAPDATPPHRFGIIPGASPLDSMPVVLTDGVNHLTNNVLGAPGGTALVVDTSGAGTLDTLVVNNTPGVQQILIDAGSRCIYDINFTNEGTLTGYGDVFCGQYAPDASGTAAAATVPSLQIRCPAGTICGLQMVAPLCCAGAVWYSSVDAGFLNTSSAPVLTLTAAAIR